jgi:hypothetical protein
VLSRIPEKKGREKKRAKKRGINKTTKLNKEREGNPQKTRT